MRHQPTWCRTKVSRRPDMGLLRTLRGSLAVPTPQAAAPAASSHVSGLSPASRPIYDRAAEGTGIFVKHIEDGVCPWQQPQSKPLEWPRNELRGTPYHGFNAIALAMSGYDDPRWCTFDQAAAKGWRVRAGEKATSIFMWKVQEKDTGTFDDDGEPITQKFPLLCRFKIFNFAQISGPEPHQPHQLTDTQARKLAEPIVETVGMTVTESATEPMGYNPERDSLVVRPRIAYPSEKHYCAALMNGVLAVAAHEAVIGLALPAEAAMTDHQRAQRDLRVEIARSMLAMRTGLPLSPPVAVKDAAILTLLQSDRREVFRAAKDAENIMRYALAFNPEILPTLEDEHREQMSAAVAEGAPEMVFDPNEFQFWPAELQQDRPRP
ncbi:ArdC-like ssDNA-binding domain-containing protein [Xanthomonas euvesicatoria]|nr:MULTISPECIES: ArdC-like ssDNA-binding domain-containing protein [Xanthomonas]MEB1409468.1 ArdC-like ssDNA-binding domain-containing protein [Xanthomonas campestris pv. campestris]MEB1511017.1 ArdC-like ssDNA-binding domain-containing protein [Xanthomonas campestris pv. campestris]MEB1763480.1 ArdC-like ssDNA-binding domain-containing protein [Xanthomonas campestris pv. campestris]MEB1874209.1 ArdC-like ssDNA-binding domain-containing protein [Xanthomonas campestris pv. campestris]